MKGRFIIHLFYFSMEIKFNKQNGDDSKEKEAFEVFEKLLAKRSLEARKGKGDDVLPKIGQVVVKRSPGPTSDTSLYTRMEVSQLLIPDGVVQVIMLKAIENIYGPMSQYALSELISRDEKSEEVSKISEEVDRLMTAVLSGESDINDVLNISDEFSQLLKGINAGKEKSVTRIKSDANAKSKFDKQLSNGLPPVDENYGKFNEKNHSPLIKKLLDLKNMDDLEKMKDILTKTEYDYIRDRISCK